MHAANSVHALFRCMHCFGLRCVCPTDHALALVRRHREKSKQCISMHRSVSCNVFGLSYLCSLSAAPRDIHVRVRAQTRNFFAPFFTLTLTLSQINSDPHLVTLTFDFHSCLTQSHCSPPRAPQHSHRSPKCSSKVPSMRTIRASSGR